MSSTRRQFLATSAGAAAAGLCAPYFFTAASAQQAQSAADRPLVGCIGNGPMGMGDARAIARFGDIVAVCDVDRSRAEKAAADEKVGKGKAQVYDDYRALLDRKDLQIVTISTPDHWHSRIAIAAMKAGKDVYCQKPLTLTIDEGKKLCRVLRETKRVFQVGTQQRSENNNMFLKAVAMVQGGRLGQVRRVTACIGEAPAGGPFEKIAPPPELNWDMWLGQAPKVDYIKERCHYTFRWWYEYSGGKMTDWGAHHVDIAQWAVGMQDSGPVSIEPVSATLPQELKAGMPTKDDCYNTPTNFQVRCRYANGVELLIVDAFLPEQLRDEIRTKDKDGSYKKDNGILFEGEKSWLFVSRGKLVGPAVDELQNNPIPDETLIKLRHGKPLGSHMENLILCTRDRGLPVSDLPTHHRSMTVCHLANIAIRLGRKLTWDPQTEQIVGDAQANAWQSRPQRKGFEVEA